MTLSSFSAEAVPVENIESLQKMLAPVKISVVVDNRGLQEEIAALPQAKYDAFLKMCNVTSPTNLTWFSICDGRWEPVVLQLASRIPLRAYMASSCYGRL